MGEEMCLVKCYVCWLQGSMFADSMHIQMKGIHGISQYEKSESVSNLKGRKSNPITVISKIQQNIQLSKASKVRHAAGHLRVIPVATGGRAELRVEIAAIQRARSWLKLIAVASDAGFACGSW
jgi:hypothetical protein